MHQRKVFFLCFLPKKRDILKLVKKKENDELVYTYFCIMVLQLSLLLFVLKNIELFSGNSISKKSFFVYVIKNIY